MSQQHPTETPEYWERLAERELTFIRMAQRTETVESVTVRQQNAADYKAYAQKLREKMS